MPLNITPFNGRFFPCLFLFFFVFFFSFRVLFEGINDFHVCLKESFPNLKVGCCCFFFSICFMVELVLFVKSVSRCSVHNLSLKRDNLLSFNYSTLGYVDPFVSMKKKKNNNEV